MSDESKSQAGQTALVVGASSGIGLALVSALIANGATVSGTQLTCWLGSVRTDNTTSSLPLAAGVRHHAP